MPIHNWHIRGMTAILLIPKMQPTLIWKIMPHLWKTMKITSMLISALMTRKAMKIELSGQHIASVIATGNTLQSRE